MSPIPLVPPVTKATLPFTENNVLTPVEAISQSLLLESGSGASDSFFVWPSDYGTNRCKLINTASFKEACELSNSKDEKGNVLRME